MQSISPHATPTSSIDFRTGAVLGGFSHGLCALELFLQFRCSDRDLSNRDAEIPVFPLLAFLPIKREINPRSWRKVFDGQIRNVHTQPRAARRGVGGIPGQPGAFVCSLPSPASITELSLVELDEDRGSLGHAETVDKMFLWRFRASRTTTRQAYFSVDSCSVRLIRRSIGVSMCVEAGDAKRGLLDEVEDWHCDLIVVGSHRLSQ